MVEEVKNKFKSFKLNKKTELLIALVLALVVVVIFVKSIKSSSETRLEGDGVEEEHLVGQPGYEEKIEARLKNIISSIHGVEQAEVFVMTESSPKILYAYDEEVTTTGSESSIIKSSKIIIFNKDGSKTEAIKSIEIYPEIKGVLVVAGGANDEKLRLMILNAVSVALDLENSKIEVLPG